VDRPPPYRLAPPYPWETLSDAELLGLRFCDLGLVLEGSALATRLARLHAELRIKGIGFQPHFWLATEWFTPIGVPGIAVPFYLAHPRLLALEKRHLHGAEGAGPREFARILRHEAGHAIANAFGLRRTAAYRTAFGDSARPYPSTYFPRPFSRRYVRHLGFGYAQSHPDEDFAETFAVWLTPGLDWRQRYRGWPALAKLESVDTLLRGCRSQAARTNRRRVDPLETQTTTLREHYAARRRKLGLGSDPRWRRDLSRVCARPDHPARAKAPLARVLARARKPAARAIALRYDRPRHEIDRILRTLIWQAQEMDFPPQPISATSAGRIQRALAAQGARIAARGRFPIPM
jgi:hypothetical protein